MPNRRNKNQARNARKNNSSLQTTNGLLRDGFKKLLEFQQAQEVRFRPEVTDIPRIRFKKDRWFNVELSYFNNITTSTTAAVTGGLSFQLSNFANVSNYTAVFDQYRIMQVSVKFIPTNTTTSSGSPGVGGVLYTVIDYDDQNTPTNLTTMLSYDSLAVTPPGQIEERTINPRLAVAAYSGAFTSFANLSNQTWIDAASSSVQYYGLKYYVSSTPTIQTVLYVETAMVQFRSQRST